MNFLPSLIFQVTVSIDIHLQIDYGSAVVVPIGTRVWVVKSHAKLEEI